MYLSAMEETKYTIAQANTKVDKKGKIIEELVSCRENLNFILSKPENIEYIDCLLYTSPSPRDRQKSRMPSSA